MGGGGHGEGWGGMNICTHALFHVSHELEQHMLCNCFGEQGGSLADAIPSDNSCY